MKRIASITLRGMAIGAIFILMAGCVTRTIYLGGRRAFPAKPQFTITPREYTEAELAAAGIRTDGVYVDVGYRPEELRIDLENTFREKGWKTGNPFRRFWANGRVMGRLPNVDHLTAEDVDSFDRATLGYFRIVTNNVIEIEKYDYHSGRGGYTYMRHRCYIEGDTLWADLGREHKGEPMQLGYRFVPIEGMQAPPDW